MNSPELSVIVAVGREDIRRCLISLLAQTFPRERYEIILVAHGSIDLPAEPNVVAVRVEADNPAVTRNAGARRARGSIVAFIDG